MGEDERMLDQGIVSRHTEDGCGSHKAVVLEVNRHTRDITDLYNKHDDTKEVLHAIKLSIAELSSRMDAGFQQSNANITSLTTEIAKIVIQRDTFSIDYYKTIKEMNDKIQKLREYEWFGEGITKWRNRLPWIIMSVVLFVVALLTYFHWNDVGSTIGTKIIK